MPFLDEACAINWRRFPNTNLSWTVDTNFIWVCHVLNAACISNWAVLGLVQYRVQTTSLN